MSQTIIDFKNTSPGSQRIKILLNGDKHVIAMTITPDGCNNKNHQQSLPALESVTIDGYEITVLPGTGTEHYNHWSYDTTSSAINPDTINSNFFCSEILFSPLVGTPGFEYNDYNALLGNAKELRRYDQVYEVDYTSITSGSILPSNIDAILSGSALIAEVQESNYTSVGLSNSKYNGAKTSILDYGVNSAVSATPFNAAIYLNSVSDTFICSQSLSDKNVKEYLFIGNDNFPTSGSRIFEVDGSRLLPIRDRKVWVESNNRTFSTDIDGYTVTPGTLCGV